jgi:glycerol-3-phosphate acyltransferase PlsY
MAAWLTALAGSYLAGSIPSAYLVVRRLKGVDIRTVGSGNVGATNVTRVAGKGAGIAVFALDMAKGLLAVLVIARVVEPEPAVLARLACGLAAVVGHVAPAFLNFRGGKGVATTIGVLAVVYPHIALICGAVWAGCFLVSRYVSLASLAAIGLLPALQWLFHRPAGEIMLGSALTALVIAKHRPNIERLLAGAEHRFGRPKA